MDIKSIAIGYAVNQGWAVFPVYGIRDGKCTCGNENCGSPGKHPIPRNGLKAATNDRRGVALMFNGLEDCNIGVATGAVSGFWVVDLDGAIAETSLQQLETRIGPMPDTLIHYTGKGRHLLFKHPGVRIKSTVKKLGPGIDVRGDGGYIVVAPSMHASGVRYSWANWGTEVAPAAEELVKLCRADSPTPGAAVNHALPEAWHDHEFTQAQVEEMISYIPPDVDYETWLSIGMGLHAAGWPLQLWDSWSRGGAKYEHGCCAARWKGFKSDHGISFGTVWHHAAAYGWAPALLDQHRDPSEPHPAQAFLDKIRSGKARPSKKTRALPIDPTSMPGLIGDTVRWILDSAVKPQPELALLNTIAALGAVFGQRYATPWDTRTNVYIVGIAGTGAGKDHSRKQVKKLMVQAGLQDYLAGDSIVSGAGLLRGVQSHPACILHLDEFGMLLKAITDERGAAHIKAAAKILTEMFSSSSGVFHGGNYASPDVKPVIIDKPALSIYGTTTFEKYVEALDRGAVSSGELNRFIVVPAASDTPPRNRDVKNLEPSPRLVAAWKSLATPIAEGQGNLQGTGAPNTAAPKAITVDWDGVLERLYDMGDDEDDLNRRYRPEGLSGVWTRYREQVIKVAMILAISRNPVAPLIEPEDLDFGEGLVRWSCEYIVDIARNHMAGSQAERDANIILNEIRKAGPEGISKRDLSRAVRGVAAKTRDTILNDLEHVQGAIETVLVRPEGAGRPSMLLRAVD